MVLGAVADVWVKVELAGSARDPSRTEVALVEILSLAIAVLLAFLFGYAYSASAATSKLRAQGRASFRRLQNLFAAIQALGTSLASERASLEEISASSGDAVPSREMTRTLEVFELHYLYQVRTATDVMEDWRDIVPEEVDDLERRSEELSRRD